jgi:hypothetical protein
VGSADFAWHSDLRDRLPGLTGIGSDGLLTAIEHVETARTAASGNGNPQAIAIVLLNDLAAALHSEGRRTGNARARRG